LFILYKLFSTLLRSASKPSLTSAW